MKTKTIKLFGIIMMLVMGMSFKACSSDDDGDDDGGGGSGQKGDLVGNWYCTFAGGEGQILYTFYSDGSYKYQEMDPNGSNPGIQTLYGDWKYINGDLMIFEGGYTTYYTECYTVKWLGNDEIKMTDDYGDSYVFERVDFSKLPNNDNSVSGSKGDLVGNWYTTFDGGQGQMLYTFYSNGEYKYQEWDPNASLDEYYSESGNWKLADGHLICGYEMDYIIVWLGDNEIRLTDYYYNESYVLKRVDFSKLPRK